MHTHACKYAKYLIVRTVYSMHMQQFTGSYFPQPYEKKSQLDVERVALELMKQ